MLAFVRCGLAWRGVAYLGQQRVRKKLTHQAHVVHGDRATARETQCRTACACSGLDVFVQMPACALVRCVRACVVCVCVRECVSMCVCVRVHGKYIQETMRIARTHRVLCALHKVALMCIVERCPDKRKQTNKCTEAQESNETRTGAHAYSQ